MKGFNILNRRGFTIIEVFVASVLAASLLGVVYNLMTWSYGTNKVNEEYTESILEARKILIKIQRELREARDLVYPSNITTNEITSTQSLVYKDRNGVLKIINFDKQTNEIKLYSLPIRDSGDIFISNGSLETDLLGEFRNNASKFILGKNVDKILFTYRKRHPGVLQLRLQFKKYNLVNSLRLLNV